MELHKDDMVAYVYGKIPNEVCLQGRMQVKLAGRHCSNFDNSAGMILYC